MKTLKILFLTVSAVLLLTVTATSQKISKSELKDCIVNNNECDDSKYYINTRYFDVNGTALSSFYKGIEINLSEVSIIPKLSISEAQDKAKSGVEDNDPNFYQQLLIGYNLALMDPFNPQNTGTDAHYIFNDLSSSSSDDPNGYYYSQSVGGKNIPNFLKFRKYNWQRSQEYVVNSTEQITSVLKDNYKAGIGMGSLGVAIKGEYQIEKTSGIKNKEMLAIYLKEKVLDGSFELTQFATFNSRFLETIIKLYDNINDYDAFVEFFEDWGTHFAKKIANGEKKYTMETYHLDQVKAGVEKGYKLKLSKDESEATSFELGSNQSLASLMNNKITTNDMHKIGSKEKPVPVIIEFMPIYHLLEAIKDPKYSKLLRDKMKAFTERYYLENTPRVNKKFLDLNSLSENQPFEVNSYYHLVPKEGRGKFRVDWHGSKKYLSMHDAETDHHQRFKFVPFKDESGNQKHTSKREPIYTIQIADGDKCVTLIRKNKHVNGPLFKSHGVGSKWQNDNCFYLFFNANSVQDGWNTIAKYYGLPSNRIATYCDFAYLQHGTKPDHSAITDNRFYLGDCFKESKDFKQQQFVIDKNPYHENHIRIKSVYNGYYMEAPNEYSGGWIHSASYSSNNDQAFELRKSQNQNRQ